MPITVNYQPAAAQVGGAAYQAGLGEFERFQQQQAQQQAMQEQEIAARMAQQQIGLAAEQQQQRMGYANQMSRDQFAAQTQGRQSEQEFQQRQQLAEGADARQFEQRKAMEELGYAQQTGLVDYRLTAESKAAEAERERLRRHVDNDLSLDPERRAEAYATIERTGSLARWEPKPTNQELVQEFEATTIPDPSNPKGRLQKDQRTGTWEPVKPFEDPELEYQRKVQADAAKAKIDFDKAAAAAKIESEKAAADLVIKKKEARTARMRDLFKIMATTKETESGPVTSPPAIEAVLDRLDQEQQIEDELERRAAMRGQPQQAAPQAAPAGSGIGWEPVPPPAPLPKLDLRGEAEGKGVAPRSVVGDVGATLSRGLRSIDEGLGKAYGMAPGAAYGFSAPDKLVQATTDIRAVMDKHGDRIGTKDGKAALNAVFAKYPKDVVAAAINEIQGPMQQQQAPQQPKVITPAEAKTAPPGVYVINGKRVELG